MSHENLEAALQAAGNPVDLLRNSQIGPYAFPVVRHEFTNWRDEQRSWRETCALFDQSHHMTDLYVEGPDALKLLSDLGVNSFKNFKVNQAKQFVACNPDGYVIGDAILFYLDENRFSLVGRPPAGNWVHYNAGDRQVQREGRARRAVRRQSGPPQVLSVSGPGPERREGDGEGHAPDRRPTSASSTWVSSRSPVTRCARCATAWSGSQAGRCSGRGSTARTVRERDRRSRPGVRTSDRWAARTYPTSCLESGWIPSPLPAVYTGDAMKAYRQWLKGTSYEAMASLGGSFYSSDIARLLPDAVRSRLRAVREVRPRLHRPQRAREDGRRRRRKKVTLVWNGEDVERALGSLFHDAATSRSTSTCRSPTTRRCRTTKS